MIVLPHGRCSGDNSALAKNLIAECSLSTDRETPIHVNRAGKSRGRRLPTLTIVTWNGRKAVSSPITPTGNTLRTGLPVGGADRCVSSGPPSQAIYLVAHSAHGVALRGGGRPTRLGESDSSCGAVGIPTTIYGLLSAAPEMGWNVFYSRRDVFSLDSREFRRTSDGGQGSRPPAGSASGLSRKPPKMISCFAKLRQTSWDRCQARAGNPGFTGARRPRFLAIQPLLDPGH